MPVHGDRRDDDRADPQEAGSAHAAGPAPFLHLGAPTARRPATPEAVLVSPSGSAGGGHPRALTEDELRAVGLAAKALIDAARGLPDGSRVAHEFVIYARLLLAMAPATEPEDRIGGWEHIEAEEKLREIERGNFDLWEVRADGTIRRLATGAP